MDNKHITEPDSLGFQVRIVRNKKEHSRYFSHKQWGGRRKSIVRARNWRDEMLVSLGSTNKYLSEKELSSRKTTTGIVGVSRSIQYDKRRDQKFLVYSVHWRKNEKAHTKTFYVGRVGVVDADTEFHAFRTATLFRREYEIAKSENLRFDPDRYKCWKTVRLYENILVKDKQVAA